MARLRYYSAHYIVEGMRFLSAPSHKVVAPSLAEAELKITLELAKKYAGKDVSVGKLRAGKEAH